MNLRQLLTRLGWILGQNIPDSITGLFHDLQQKIASQEPKTAYHIIILFTKAFFLLELNYQYYLVRGAYGWCLLILCMMNGYIEPFLTPTEQYRWDQWVCLVHVISALSSLSTCAILSKVLPFLRGFWETWFGMDYVKQRLSNTGIRTVILFFGGAFFLALGIEFVYLLFQIHYYSNLANGFFQQALEYMKANAESLSTEEKDSIIQDAFRITMDMQVRPRLGIFTDIVSGLRKALFGVIPKYQGPFGDLF